MSSYADGGSERLLLRIRLLLKMAGEPSDAQIGVVDIERSDADRRPCMRANVRSKFPGLHEGNRHGRRRALRLQLHIAGLVHGIGLGPLSPMPRQSVFRVSRYATCRRVRRQQRVY